MRRNNISRVSRVENSRGNIDCARSVAEVKKILTTPSARLFTRDVKVESPKKIEQCESSSSSSSMNTNKKRSRSDQRKVIRGIKKKNRLSLEELREKRVQAFKKKCQRVNQQHFVRSTYRQGNNEITERMNEYSVYHSVLRELNRGSRQLSITEQELRENSSVVIRNGRREIEVDSAALTEIFMQRYYEMPLESLSELTSRHSLAAQAFYDSLPSLSTERKESTTDQEESKSRRQIFEEKIANDFTGSSNLTVSKVENSSSDESSDGGSFLYYRKTVSSHHSKKENGKTEFNSSSDSDSGSYNRPNRVPYSINQNRFSYSWSQSSRPGSDLASIAFS